MSKVDRTGRRLEGRRALITGGSRGIGAAIASAFAEEGCDVACCHLDDDGNAEALARELQSGGRRTYMARCDVSNETSVDEFVQSARDQLGGDIDILVNNAGYSGETAFQDITPSLFDRMIAVHLRGTFLMTRACYPAMKMRRCGRIINITSQLAYKGDAGFVHYCAAKAGIVGFTRAMAREAAPYGVLVNAIAPGPIDTGLMAYVTAEWQRDKLAQLPLNRWGTTKEIAPTAVLLASDDGGYYVGQTLSPNGGDVML